MKEDKLLKIVYKIIIENFAQKSPKKILLLQT